MTYKVCQSFSKPSCSHDFGSLFATMKTLMEQLPQNNGFTLLCINADYWLSEQFSPPTPKILVRVLQDILRIITYTQHPPFYQIFCFHSSLLHPIFSQNATRFEFQLPCSEFKQKLWQRLKKARLFLLMKD